MITGCKIDWKAGKDVTLTTVKVLALPFYTAIFVVLISARVLFILKVKTISGKKGKSGVSPKKITKEVSFKVRLKGCPPSNES